MKFREMCLSSALATARTCPHETHRTSDRDEAALIASQVGHRAFSSSALAAEPRLTAAALALADWIIESRSPQALLSANVLRPWRSVKTASDPARVTPRGRRPTGVDTPRRSVSGYPASCEASPKETTPVQSAGAAAPTNAWRLEERAPSLVAPSPHDPCGRPRLRYPLASRASDAGSGRGIGLGSIPFPRHRSQGSGESSLVRVGRVPVPPHAAHLSASNEPRGSGRERSGTVSTASRSGGREAGQGQRPARNADPALLAAHVNHGYSLLALGPGGGRPSGSCRGVVQQVPDPPPQKRPAGSGKLDSLFVADRARPARRGDNTRVSDNEPTNLVQGSLRGAATRTLASRHPPTGSG